ncbi:hypothetical protein QE177_10000 [Arsenophonus sp. aPb]|uniref:hypothetical protein n=1 Tax=Arsenophonus sp. aPb TaxID=3041619 RepID=UPI002468231E|nr:hypothetical protein [Arsenophonus sp. aPb]WGL97537.1 hypothetical protein QE177_10000 [Arsenophonus sp. aPb]
MKSTIKILIITTLLSANFFALAGDKTPSSSTVTDSDAIIFKDDDDDKDTIVFKDDDKAVKISCNSPTHEYGGEGCIDIR